MHDFSRWVSALGDSETILLDISVFTKPYIAAIIHTLRHIGELKSIDVIYTEPVSYYRTNLREFELATGPYQLVNFPGFPGSHLRGSDELMVILLGFDGAESVFMREKIDPARTVAINGFPSYLLQYKDISMVHNAALLESPTIQEGLRFAPANDPFETVNVIRQIVAEDTRRNRRSSVTIAPLGTKPMALGAVLYALEDWPKVRLAFPLPKGSRVKAGREVGRTWLYRLPLSAVTSERPRPGDAFH